MAGDEYDASAPGVEASAPRASRWMGVDSKFCYILTDLRPERSTMNVSLTPELERRIAEKVESGLYTTASEVVREALRLLFEADEKRERLIAKLNDEIQIGLDQIERGEVVSPEEVWADVDAIIEAARTRR
jgi:antitoxin ParD1/3/4